MAIDTFNYESIPVRELQVSTRAAGQEAIDHVPPGLLIESVLGRYVLDRDAREVWFRIDGVRSVEEIAAAIAADSGASLDDLRDPVLTCLNELLANGLLEPVGPSAATLA